jgi:hypothetical protein
VPINDHSSFNCHNETTEDMGPAIATCKSIRKR